ncbi:NPC intracellular cholesterol transporter 2-like [Physella acuta]|uniref:NPC intracellular cholesterol transporter 2-like n=1 Tax=Physella acuta TaxID=109671 RepID=UPI0027DD1BE2|nr:NPC intracellular cholesterol transporter 2-like [Physella acuta]
MKWTTTILFVFAGVAFGIVSAEVIPIHDCGSKAGTITQIDVTPCSTIPCPFKRNTNVSVTITFTANQEITEAVTSVHGIIAGVPVPFPLPDPNACHFMTCPIASGATGLYKNAIFVQQVYPKITLLVKYELVASDSTDAVCFTVPATIVD